MFLSNDNETNKTTAVARQQIFNKQQLNYNNRVTAGNSVPQGTSMSKWLQTEDGGDNMLLRNVHSHKICMIPQPRRRHSS
jgi:hypothetical protein